MFLLHHKLLHLGKVLHRLRGQFVVVWEPLKRHHLPAKDLFLNLVILKSPAGQYQHNYYVAERPPASYLDRVFTIVVFFSAG